jgi:MFS transporter, FHS family, L-fucose permease
LRKKRSHLVLGTYALINVFVCGIVVLKLGWISVTAVFMSFLFMSIMFPTIFTLGIYGLGTQAKKASGYIVMAIIGGSIMPKLMGHLGDIYNMSVGFLIPMGCFALITMYGFLWPRLSKTHGMVNVSTTSGH